ncbi:MAG: hypothetical protein N3E36_02190 [Sulfolobales archaeon]|nr:hypothetical protein [Sulfolobales archaeon]
MNDIVIAAEKNIRMKIELVLKFLEELANTLSKDVFSRVGLVIFSSYAFPILDLTYNYYKICEVYRIIRPLKGVPEPALGIYEAIDMIRDLDDGLADKRAIALITSLSEKPRIPLVDALNYAKAQQVHLAIATTNTEAPPWLPEDIARELVQLRSDNIFKIIKLIVSDN